MNILELRDRDPKRFEEEYYKWTEYALDYEWWDYLYDNFKADCMPMGVYVDNITFSGFHSQGDGVSFAGRMYIFEWMEQRGFDKTHLAAYIAAKDDASYVSLTIGRGNNMRSNYEGWENGVGPSGIFAELDDQTWDTLVNDQLGDLSVEDEVLSFCEDLAAKLYRKLELEYEHLTSKSMFIEMCECNEVTFEENEDALQDA
jgi:hypothetical protein